MEYRNNAHDQDVMKGEFRDRKDARRGYLAFNEATKRLTFRGRAGEEAIAIMVANILSSEINRPLRRDRHSFAQMNISSADFFLQSGDMIRVFYHQHPEFCRWVAEAVVPFNPVRTYYLTLTGVPRLRSA